MRHIFRTSLILLWAMPCLLIGYNISEAAKPGTTDGMVLIDGGCFTMGSDLDESIDNPAHKVCLDAFYMDIMEVTQKQYKNQTGETPSMFKGGLDRPVESVTWDQANDYCTAIGKRLPTEAEWEYASRAGNTKLDFAGTSDKGALDSFAWTDFNSSEVTHPAGTKQANPLGLYDMTGNISEWVADWYSKDYYLRSPKFNPRGPDTGELKVSRGGSWCTDIYTELMVVHRKALTPDLTTGRVGFRCAKSP